MKTEAFIRARVVERIKELREQQEVPYKELARRLVSDRRNQATSESA